MHAFSYSYLFNKQKRKYTHAYLTCFSFGVIFIILSLKNFTFFGFSVEL